MDIGETLARVDWGKLDLDQRRELLNLLEEYNASKSNNRLAGYQPYPKQLEFHNAGALPGIRERCLIASNQCIGPFSPIETPEGERQAGVALLEKGLCVLALAGGQECIAPARNAVLKGIEPMFRVLLDNGRFFDSTRRHRVLTHAGWLSLDLLTSRAGGLHWKQTHADFLASYAWGDRQHGRLLPLEAGSGQDEPRPPADVPPRSPLVFSPEDAAARTPEYIRACLATGPLSIVACDRNPLAALFERFAGPAVPRFVLHTNESTQSVQRFVDASAAPLRPTGEARQPGLSAAPSSATLDRLERLCAGDRPAQLPGLGRVHPQSLSWKPPGSPSLELLHDGVHTSIFLPWRPLGLVGGAAIVAVVPVGYQPVLDIQVPDHHNYKGAGVYHHNSGKTYSAAAETAMHLTGRYPPWWTGRRWTSPVNGWAGSNTGLGTRDTVQRLLMGRPGEWGTGQIPKECIVEAKRSTHGVADSLDTVIVRHIGGGRSSLAFKCHPAGMRVVMSDGTWRPVESVRIGDTIRSPDGVPRTVSQLHAYANAPVLRIKTESGILDATPNHPVFTKRGKINAVDLQIGDIVERADVSALITTKQDDWKVVLTAVMIGDGCTRGKTPFFTSNDPKFVAELEAEFMPEEHYVVRVRNTISYKISSKLYKLNYIKNSLESDGLWDVKSKDKFIPEWVFSLPRDKRVLFLRWLYGCDGSLNPKEARYTSASSRLINDVHRLLLTLGITSVVVERMNSNGSGKLFKNYYISLYGYERIAFEEIGKAGRNPNLKSDLKPRGKKEWGRVLSIEPLLNQAVYCVGVEGKHELIVEGYRVGNSYDQGRERWQGETLDLCWLDEEPPEDIYSEGRTRTNATGGMVYMTFTPLLGMSAVVKRFIKEKAPGTCVIRMTIDDALHYTPQQREAITASYKEHEREARVRGNPVLGSGAVYGVIRSAISVPAFALPNHWPRICGIDFGWDHPFAAAWLAWDRDTDTLYLYDTFRQRESTPAAHTVMLRAKGPWIPVAWPHDGMQHEKGTGETLAHQYKKHGANMLAENATFQEGGNSVEAGVMSLLERMRTGRFKVFSHLDDFWEEMELYHRKEGRIVKEDDDLLDAIRYASMSLRFAKTQDTSTFAPRVDPFGLLDTVAGY